MLFEALSRADRDARERGLGHVDGKLRFRTHELGEASKERAAAHEHDPTVRDVGGKLGRGAFKRLLDGVDDLTDRSLKCLANLLGPKANPF
jgi:hypothetical protein